MSFVRVGRPLQHNKGKRLVRPKKAAAPKREWVVSTGSGKPWRLDHRHEIHQSHNKAAAQWDLREKALNRRLKHNGSPAPLDQASLNIIREVLSDQLLLKDVLARSDRAMAVVKDLFGDAPRRQTGHPSVTMAPHCDSDSELPVLQRPDPPTQLSLLSQSMMDQQVCVCQDKKMTYIGFLSYFHNDTYVIYQSSTVYTLHIFSALNATVAVQRVRTRQSQPEEAKEEQSVLVAQVLNPDVPFNQSVYFSELGAGASSVASLSGDQSSLGLLQAMLGQVEADLDTLSPDTAPGSAQSPKRHRTQGLTGFSVALISTLGRFVHHLKQMDERVQKEAEERKNMEEELREQRGLIDALTAETMALREEAAALQVSTELHSSSGTSLLLRVQTVQINHFHSLSPPLRQGCSSGPQMTLPVPSHQQLLPIDNIRSREDIQASSSSLASLPLTSLPSTSSLSLTSSDPLSSKLPAEALLAEIAQLSRQNELIKAQLSQAKILWSGVGASPDCGSEQRSRSSSGSGRFTPQSFGETRTSGSSSTRRQSQNIQRLLELNRQSAAARGRLLDLIEQQKNNVSSKVSPSASPIPTSAFSPHAAGTVRGGSPEVSMLLPSKEFLRFVN
uniref:Spindle and centriole-associated protein 1 n=1 Tax=Scophthalmus maximus TaxID=52904 RepID=A0A8D3ATM9_SCOMX